MLHTGTFLWPHYAHPTKLACPTLPDNLEIEVTIVGGGISGLMTAYHLWKANIPFILIEAEQIGYGSTLVNTGLVQYSSDIRLTDLRSRIGREEADLFYLASKEAIIQLEAIAEVLKTTVGDPHFKRRSSIQYASSEEDNVLLTQQYNAYRSIQLPCELLGINELNTYLPLEHVMALKTNQDAEINPYLFTRYLAKFLLNQGVKLFEYATLHCESGHTSQRYSINHTTTLKSKQLIYCVGYQPEQLNQPYIKPTLNRSYVIATNPIEELSQNYNGDFIWETAHPYFYVRATVDDRIIIGGLDEIIASPNTDKHLIEQANQRLLQQLKLYFPKLDVNIAFSWNATFAESTDTLPFIGPNPNDESVSYLCGYGGNGTVYSVIGAQLLTEYIHSPATYKLNKLAAIVKLDR